MDFKPANLFVRGSDEFGYRMTLGERLTAFRYYDRSYSTNRALLDAIESDASALRLPPSTFWTTWGRYTGREALTELALPGDVPTHVLKVDLPPGTVVQGPAWVQFLPRSLAFSALDLERAGNGLEFQTVNPIVSGEGLNAEVWECP